MSGSDAYKGGGTQAERRAYWAAFWEAEAIKSEIRLKRLQAIAAQVIPVVQNVDPPPIPSAGEVQKVAMTGYVKKLYEANPLLNTLMKNADPHAADHASGMRPMSGTVVQERGVKKWPSGAFPIRAMKL